MASFLLQETGDFLLQETGDKIVLDEAGRSLTIDGDDFLSDIQYASFSLTECANRGEVGTGGFDMIDPASVLDIPALKAVQFADPAAVGNTRVFTGYTHERTTTALRDQSLTARQWGVETVDLNILASDYVLTNAESANRPAETDYVRVAWLLTSRLNTEAGVAVGIVPNTNTVTMEATDYRGRTPADLLAECSEASGKLWFIYDYGSGPKLYYDLATGTSLTSTAKLSDTSGDPDGTTVFKVIDTSVKKSPDRIYSKVHLTYTGGTVSVSDPAVATAYRTREAHVLDSSITDSALATTKANALLAGAAAELTEVEDLTTIVAAAYVNDIRPGQRVQIKLSRHGISAYTYYRVVRRTVTPLGSDYYQLVLGLASDVLASANGARGTYEIWQHTSNANDDGPATVIVDDGGLSIIDGALTVVNSGATVIIDGESDMFRIAASGSQNHTTASASLTTTLTGLGTLAATPIAILTHASSADPTVSQSSTLFALDNTDYLADTSGGAVTKLTVSSLWVRRGDTALNGSDQATVSVTTTSATGAISTYQYYYVLEQTAF